MGRKYTGEDRRKYKRLVIKPIVKLVVNSAPEGKEDIVGLSSVGVMLDIGEGGLAVLLDKKIPALALVSSDFTLSYISPLTKDSYRSIGAYGEVCYSKAINVREYRIGVAFRKISDSDKSFIAQFVDWERVRLPSG
jgi:hypothetical protein